MSENSMTITGTVETALPLEEFPSGFTKRVLVINTGGDYPQLIPVEFVKDKTELITGLVKGQEVTAHINIRGREYEGKYFSNVQGWRLEKGEAKSAPKPEPVPAVAEDEDDVPF